MSKPVEYIKKKFWHADTLSEAYDIVAQESQDVSLKKDVPHTCLLSRDYYHRD